MKKSMFVVLLGMVVMFQNTQAQSQKEELKSPFESLQQEMMKMLEQFGFQEGGSSFRMDTLLIQPFGLFPGMDSLQNQDMMQQWQGLSEQLLKSLQGGDGGMNGLEELFKQFPLFDGDWLPPAEDPKQPQDGTKPQGKKRKIYKI